MLSSAVRFLVFTAVSSGLSACVSMPINTPGACDGPCPCAADTDCANATPRCDRNTGKCVPCLPLNDNCPQGAKCVASNDSFRCNAGCATSADCPRSDAGTATQCCIGACLDTSTDIKNCGECGKACAALPHASSVCAAGSCALASCDSGFGNCDNVLANGCEAAITTDVKNCGACGKACPGGPNSATACAGGTCSLTCTMNYGDCDKNPATGCEANLLTDPNNCGACGSLCGMLANAQSACMAGGCAIVSCNPGFVDCNNMPKDGCEANTLTDAANCGACGKACNPANAVGQCTSGNCSIASCKMGFADCDGIAANGCETPVSMDPNNCGACAHVCAAPHSTQDCQMGACILTGCAQGFADCDKNPVNGCEVNVGMDVMNCGGCGKLCPMVANGVPACTNAVCGVGMCKFGYAHCSMNPMDGCEVNIAMDVANCGQCANACPAVANGTPGCKTGMCGIAMCNNLFGDCDGNPMNGCEKSLATDVNNCGKCGNVCNFANAMGACLNGQCGISQCNQGFADCDMNAANGCEVNVNTDAKNCGKCGTVCPMNAALCSNGVCVARFVFQKSQTIDGQTVTCSAVISNNTYTECDDLNQNNLYFPNGIFCGPVWSMQNSPYSDTAGFCKSLTMGAMEAYYTCNNSQLRTTWKNHVWGTASDNGYTQHLRCYY